ncbi:phosphate ABC transporter, inner membrane subunit PstA [Deinococcus proteolyticus MRP]|uniref:Phosphate transport system permease protein PstA n=1 Tax=Deinococcus proteolyticus (strain ATCC 35074 / DSM 20540 / JCM 6276 / NBRC 101906 / NCIMB 13154 / VKM Ac-1939 / CCM 2703 / MRP) TaxID=693977 RepID=F0RKV5_DEIPM|nr:MULTISPECIES: phosphate ABC transporter permease PstA [Deinococcus]ADY26817.1 phosphate ABC transporter, inner membrane subunit PstA [Deinococcus proteolyticus MRP]MCY1702938.1 phosphate ABC transporter permease PstA [Deinococcus sp. SL84]
MSAVQQNTAATRRAVPGLSPARKFTNSLMGGLIGLGTLLVVAPLLLIFYYLLTTGLQALSPEFFTQTPAPLGETGGGLKNAIIGSVTMLGMASVIGILVGVAGGIFLSEYPRHPLMPTVRMLSDVLAGIPAIVMGLVVYGLLVLQFGFSGLAGSIALGFLMIPIVVRTTEETLKLVPRATREAGLALGLPNWKVILQIVLPAAAGGIVTGIMLALARVAGEAAPLLFTAFGNNAVTTNLTQPMSALPVEIFKLATSAYETDRQLAQAASLVLILLILITSLLARYFSSPRKMRVK